MSLKIPDDLVKIKYHENGTELVAETPDGQRLKCIISIDISSSAGSQTEVVIRLIADLSKMGDNLIKNKQDG